MPLVYYAYTGLINAVVCGLILVVALLNRPRSALVQLFSYLALLISVWGWFYFLWLRVTTDAVQADFLERTCMVPVVLMPPTFLHFSSLLTGRMRWRSIHIANHLLSVPIALTVYTSVFSPGVAPHQVFPFWLLPGPTFVVHFVHMVSMVVLGLWLIADTALRSTGQFRLQLWWAFWPYLIGWFSGFTNYFVWFRLSIPPILNGAVSLCFLALAYAILRHQLLDIRIVIRRSLVYSVLIATITACYLVMVLIMEKWFQGFFGYRSIFATVFVAFLIAIFFNPLRNRIQALVDRALFKATPAELAEQREQLLAEIRKSEQMKAVGTLAAGLAHEIKNPLASIKTFTDYLDQRYHDPEFRAKFKKIVGGEVERINLIVQQLLEFSKPTPPRLQPIELRRLVDETLEFLNSEFVQRHVQVNRSYDNQAQVLGDSQQLKQVFLNLFLNSLQAMNGMGKLDIRTAYRGAKLSVTISDTGTGITPADLPHIFEPFFTTKANGTGLGLAVVQSIIKEHGGRIEVESQAGQGTRVQLNLPLATDTDADRPC